MLFFKVDFLYKFILEEFQMYHLLGLTKQVDVDVTVACAASNSGLQHNCLAMLLWGLHYRGGRNLSKDRLKS